MTQNNTRFTVVSSPRPLNYAAQKLNQLQADLVSTARMWAVDEVGAAIAHQVNEPLTALLLYLHGIRDASEASPDPDAMREMVEKALREAERLSEIIERIGYSVAPVDAESAMARGREAIDWCTRSSNEKAGGYAPPALPGSGQHRLTRREREVVALITEGISNKEGGHRLGISTRTFEVHRAHIMEKLGAKNAADLVRIVLSESENS